MLTLYFAWSLIFSTEKSLTWILEELEHPTSGKYIDLTKQKGTNISKRSFTYHNIIMNI